MSSSKKSYTFNKIEQKVKKKTCLSTNKKNTNSSRKNQWTGLTRYQKEKPACFFLRVHPPVLM